MKDRAVCVDKTGSSEGQMSEVFETKFDVEHALVLYASNFVAMSAAAIYEDEAIRPHLAQIRDCHIYLIGLTPKIDIADLRQEGNDLVAVINVANAQHEVRCSLPSGAKVVGNPGAGLYVEINNRRIQASDVLMRWLHFENRAVGFEVLYIGQAYGVEGSRNALERLRKHETLQKISIKGIPEGYTLTILMLSVELGYDLVTAFSPHAEDKTKGEERIDAAMLYDRG
ncbi:MAG: hypothetical protein WB715_09375 [Roseiarcus sp.]|uniref:hypothetical protein n=1 Tax=Roseiarcus sp. TaxID=1969460 RepID=UPI003C471D18